MRSPVDASRVVRFLTELGRSVRGPGRIYLTGGASALLEGWRSSTIDIDVKLDPEPAGVFEAIARLKDQLDTNVELSAPDQFLPELPDWRSRSRFIDRFSSIDAFHYDFRAQALSKLARHHDRDQTDVAAMIESGAVEPAELLEAYEAIEKDLIRFPSLDSESFERRVRQIARKGRGDG